MLFAITDAYRKRTIFGVEIVQEIGNSQDPSKMRLNLFWTEPQKSQSQIGQSWEFEATQDDWAKFAISIRGHLATLYTGCDKATTMTFDRTLKQMPIPPNANFYLGKGDLFGRTYQVTIN